MKRIFKQFITKDMIVHYKLVTDDGRDYLGDISNSFKYSFHAWTGIETTTMVDW